MSFGHNHINMICSTLSYNAKYESTWEKFHIVIIRLFNTDTYYKYHILFPKTLIKNYKKL